MQIENYRQQPETSTTEAYFDVYFPNSQCRYRNLRLIRGKKGKFVAMPCFKVETPEGKPQFLPYVEYSEEKGKEFMRKVYDALKESGFF